MSAISIPSFLAVLKSRRDQIFPQSTGEYWQVISDTAQTALNIISSSDALYHDVEHTCLVTLCGQEIFIGKKILDGDLVEKDWVYFTISLLLHDIGYVRNILPEDSGNSQKISSNGSKHNMGIGDTDASLTPYHIERGKLFIENRNWPDGIDKNVISEMIGYTEFPIPKSRQKQANHSSKSELLATLIGSSDLIGQLADPSYDIKIPRLYFEFLETGTADNLGYRSAEDLRKSYPSFFYNFVNPNIEQSIKYLNATPEGQKWTSLLNYHVFSQENRAILEQDGVRLLQEIHDYCAGSTDLNEIIKFTLQKVCSYQSWPIGHAYKRVDTDTGPILSSSKIWHISSENDLFKKWKNISEGHTFHSGEGLPGRVFENGEPAWITDVTKDKNFPRSKLASDIGVKGAFAFPVYSSGGIDFVLEFYSEEAEDLDSSVLSFMEQISYEITNHNQV